MNRDLLKTFYDRRHLSSSDFEFAVSVIEELESYLSGTGASLADAEEASLDDFIQVLVHEKKNTIPVFVAMMRYFFVTDRKDLYIHLTRYTGADEVIETILARTEKQLGKETVGKILKGISVPILGTPPKAYPEFTAKFIKG